MDALGRAAVLGLLAGGTIAIGLVATGSTVQDSSSTAFALGALVMGFGLTTWATSIWLGDVLETFLVTTETGSDWTKADAVTAFSVITMVGGGAMVGSVLVTLAMWSLGM